MTTKPHRKHPLPFCWPDPPFRIVLVEPEIPPNTGNIARLCVATGSPLHLIEPLGFQLTDKAMKRAGLDYWASVEIFRHSSWDAFMKQEQPGRLWFFTTGGRRGHFDAAYEPGDFLVFGCETRGLPESLLKAHADQVLGIPMKPGQVRSLNLAHAAGIVLYEALRQIQSG